VLRFTRRVTFEAFAANDEKRAAVKRQVFVIGDAAARLPEERSRRLTSRLCERGREGIPFSRRY